MCIELVIKGDIARIEEVLVAGQHDDCKRLYNDLVNIYSTDIPDISNGLSQDRISLSGPGYAYRADYKRNLDIVKRKLELYLIKREESKKQVVERNSQAPVSVNVNNTNTSSSDNHSTNTNSNANTANIDLKVMFEQARKTIDDDESLNDIEVSEIIERINQLEELASSDENKRSKWNKCKEVMTWLFEKGAKVAGTILPLITEIIKQYEWA